MQDVARHTTAMELTDLASGSRTELPVLVPTIGSEMVDVRGIKRATGRYVFDPGLTATGICRSAITYVDGDSGVLLYRGYPIDQLVDRSMRLAAPQWRASLSQSEKAVRLGHHASHHAQ